MDRWTDRWHGGVADDCAARLSLATYCAAREAEARIVYLGCGVWDLERVGREILYTTLSRGVVLPYVGYSIGYIRGAW